MCYCFREFYEPWSLGLCPYLNVLWSFDMTITVPFLDSTYNFISMVQELQFGKQKVVLLEAAPQQLITSQIRQ